MNLCIKRVIISNLLEIFRIILYLMTSVLRIWTFLQEIFIVAYFCESSRSYVDWHLKLCCNGCFGGYQNSEGSVRTGHLLNLKVRAQIHNALYMLNTFFTFRVLVYLIHGFIVYRISVEIFFPFLFPRYYYKEKQVMFNDSLRGDFI